MNYGRTPTAQEWNKSSPGHPTTHQLTYAFGSFNAALTAAGFSLRKCRGSDKIPRNTRVADKVERLTELPEDELERLITEQEKDWRYRFRSYALDPLSQRYAINGYYSDGWTHSVHHQVDQRRQIDAWAEAA